MSACLKHKAALSPLREAEAEDAAAAELPRDAAAQVNRQPATHHFFSPLMM